jgi:hypothetical protein
MSLSLPSIKLEGANNYSEWECFLISYLELKGLSLYISDEVPDDFVRDKTTDLKVCGIIKLSLQPALALKVNSKKKCFGSLQRN